MPTLGDFAESIRRRVNDQTTYPDGEEKPDHKYSDRDIAIETQTALLNLLHKEPRVFYPDSMTADSRIIQATTISGAALTDEEAAREVPVPAAYIPGLQGTVVAALETTDQSGARPEVRDQIADLNTAQPT